MNLPFVQKHKKVHAGSIKKDENGTYNLLLKAATFDRVDIVKELYDSENVYKFETPANLNSTELKPGFNCFHTAIACKADKVVDFIMSKDKGKLDKHITDDGQTPLVTALKYRNVTVAKDPEVLRMFNMSSNPEFNPLRHAV